MPYNPTPVPTCGSRDVSTVRPRPEVTWTVWPLKPVTLARLTRLVFGQMFHALEYDDDVPLWTDDYSDLLSAIAWD